MFTMLFAFSSMSCLKFEVSLIYIVSLSLTSHQQHYVQAITNPMVQYEKLLLCILSILVAELQL